MLHFVQHDSNDTVIGFAELALRAAVLSESEIRRIRRRQRSLVFMGVSKFAGFAEGNDLDASLPARLRRSGGRSA
jgi:hypothetical protein